MVGGKRYDRERWEGGRGARGLNGEKRAKRGKWTAPRMMHGGMTVLVWALWRGNSVYERRMRVNKQLYYPNHPSSI